MGGTAGRSTRHSRHAPTKMASPPDSLEAYLDQNAPDLQHLAGSTLTTDGFVRGDRVYIHQPRSEGPWFWFDFDWQGRIGVVQQEPWGVFPVFRPVQGTDQMNRKKSSRP